jgi:hypothetical protein
LEQLLEIIFTLLTLKVPCEPLLEPVPALPLMLPLVLPEVEPLAPVLPEAEPLGFVELPEADPLGFMELSLLELEALPMPLPLPSEPLSRT